MRRMIRRSTEGQAAVETAIVAPMFIFMILGLLQFSLLMQARSMAKYAAYRAARTGALNNACLPKMQDEALATLVPVIAMGDALLKSKNITEYGVSYAKVKLNHYLGALPIVDVRICGPLDGWFTNQTFKNGNEVDFDDWRNLEPFDASTSPNSRPSGAKLRGFERLKLKVQVKYNHKLIIPFANAVFFRIWLYQKFSETLRMSDRGGGAKDSNIKFKNDVGKRTAAESTTLLKVEAARGKYYFPIYAAYAFRMQSNLYMSACKLPTENKCWHYDDGTAAGAP